jgi:hypothetical protein
MHLPPKTTRIHQEAIVISLDTRVCLRPNIHVARKDKDLWVLWIGHDRKELSGKSISSIVEPLLEHLTEERAVGDLVCRASATTGESADDVHAVIDRLFQWQILDIADGYIENGRTAPFKKQIELFSGFSSHPVGLQERLLAATVGVVGQGLPNPELEAALRGSGIGTVAYVSQEKALEEPCNPPNREEPDLFFVYGGLEPDEYVRVNRRAIDTGRPLLVCGLIPSGAYVGPLVLPGESACLECVRVFEDRNGLNVSNAPDGGRFASLLPVIFHLAATECVKALLAPLRPSLTNVRLLVDLNSFSFQRRSLPKLLRCPVCSLCRKHAPVSTFESQPTAAFRP